ncbi:MAG TPA: glycosyltransferase family 2 protein [Bryobacteraceae bacterium]|jgi:glycosyltransferase involved in cell wall biosynthesis
MKLLIAIPAYNEEQSIEPIIQRSLAAREYITAMSPVDEVDIAVVSDGSTDRTLEIAKAHDHEIKVIGFERNRGYGAAIQEAWKQSDAELLGFLDADGTCDPRFFAPLCRVIEADHADVAIGCRMNKESKMPALRRVGNTIFATLLGLFSSTRVRDTASGMRVVRRASLDKLEPLPTGMHFTPAMSARAMLDRNLKMHEIDMPYAEREGRSKLSVVRDGIRFLKVIVEAAFLYRPERPLSMLASACLAAGVLLMIEPSIYYLTHRAVAEWMIYRFIVSNLAGVAAFLLFSASYVTARIVAMTLQNGNPRRSATSMTRAFLHSGSFWVIPLLLMFFGGLLVLPSFLELVRTGATYEHWSRFIAMSFLFSLAIILLTTRACDYILDLLESRLEFLRRRTLERQGKVAA